MPFDNTVDIFILPCNENLSKIFIKFIYYCILSFFKYILYLVIGISFCHSK